MIFVRHEKKLVLILSPPMSLLLLSLSDWQPQKHNIWKTWGPGVLQDRA